MKSDIKHISTACVELVEYLEAIVSNPIDDHDILAADN